MSPYQDVVPATNQQTTSGRRRRFRSALGGLITDSTACAVFDGDGPELLPAPMAESAELRVKPAELLPSLRHWRTDYKKE
jgi:hypothetical protein